MDEGDKEDLKNPRENASIISKATFAWLLEIFRLGFTRNLEKSDIYSVLHEYSSELIGDRIAKSWKKEKLKNETNRNNPSLIKVLAKCFAKELFINGFFLTISRLFLRIIEAFLLIQVLSFFNGKQETENKEIYYWASGLILLKIILTTMTHLNVLEFSNISLKVKVACSSLIYKKILRLSKNSMAKETSVGQVVNILSQDVRILELFAFYCYFLLFTPIQIIAFGILVFWQMGFIPILGFSITLLTILVQGLIAKWLGFAMEKCVSLTDKRLSLMSEIITGIQVIKMYGWEKPFSYLVEKTRMKEMSVIKRMSIVSMVFSSFRMFVPQLCLFITVVCSIAFETTISPEKVYMLALLYSELDVTYYFLFNNSVQYLAKARISARRIEVFINSQEKEFHNNYCDQNHKNPFPIRLLKVSFKWSPASKEETLKDITMTLKSGTLTAVIGPVASGKSSLLQVILGEVSLQKGSTKVVRQISYASQEPWVFASSLRQNILFGQPMIKERYEKVLRVCQLQQDIASLPFGDETPIGEKGIKMSGGQKARINLARAVYSEADIYIFDDPLSAVDTEVGKRIFEDCICGFLKDKTRILVTHQLQYLQTADRILVFSNGSLQAEGTLDQLLESNVDFLKAVTAEKQENSETIYDDSNVDEKTQVMEKEALNQEEVSELKTLRQVGTNSDGVFWSYLKSVGNPWIVLMTMVLGLSYRMFLTGGDYFLSRWMNTEQMVSIERIANGTLVDPEGLEVQRQWYILVCSILYISVAFTIYGFTVVFYEMTTRASQRLHQSMFCSMIHSTMFFFHENSSGRILNRFSKDIGTIDKELPQSLSDVIRISLTMLAVSIISLYFNPWIVLLTLILGLIQYFLCIFCMKTIYRIKHLEASTRSPVLSHVNATLDGLITVRALKAEKILAQEYDNHQNLNTSAEFIFIASTRALGYYLEILTLLFVASVIFLIISFRDHIYVGDAGFIITQLFRMCSTLQWGIRQATEVENQMTSVERVLEYTDLDQEPSFETKTENKPPNSWPSNGQLEFRNLYLSYHPGGTPVLKDVNFVILPREKVGIVGRTGAGKTSLISALFRLAHVEGEIYIDDVETSRLGLYDLRSNISIIPQQPLLFAGSLRRNLDPFDEYSDEELWQALEDVEMKHILRNMEAGLDAKLSDGGSNLSVGQRQLLSLARAILRKNKILVLDEATANLDLQTDELIQKTIRRRFKDCTVLIIAHRLNTVMDCDKLIVMDEGTLVEFDHPYSLLQNKGYLYKLVQQTGPHMSKVLTKIAQKVKKL